MASFVYNHAATGIMDGSIDLLADTIKVLLVGTGTPYTPSHDDDFITASGVAASEISVTGYTGGFAGAGRKTLASKTVTEDDSNDRATFDAADLTWTALAAGATIAAAILVKEVTNDAASLLLAYIDLTDTPLNGSDITVQWSANGIINLTT